MATIVDLTAINLGRDIGVIREVAEKAEMQVVAATGLYWTEEPWLMAWSPDRLAEYFVRDIEEGEEITDDYRIFSTHHDTNFIHENRRIEEIKPWPDHLLAHWDSRVLDALLVSGIQEQPLLGFVPDKAWRSVCKLYQKPETYRSVSESLPLRYKMVAFPSPAPKARKSRPSLGAAKNLLAGDLTVPTNRWKAMGAIR